MAKKKLGQHFLKNKTILKKIASLVEPYKNLPIIEIGGGHGELTEILLQFFPSTKIVTVEKDKKLADFLSSKFKNHNNLEIQEGDILRLFEKIIQEKKLKNLSYVVLGNIPYYITGYILRKISEIEKKPKAVIFLLQKEVAQRVVARSPKMNLLAAFTQFWATPKIITYVKKENFYPQPKVDSAILYLEVKKINKKIFPQYINFVKALFKQPRKTIFNNLKRYISQENIQKIFRELGIDPKERPHNLDIDTIQKMFKIIIRA